MATKRTTLTLPPDLIEEAKEHGIKNISQFCTRAIRAFVQGAKDPATRILLEDIAKVEAKQRMQADREEEDQELERIIQEHIDGHRPQLLRHLAQYGTVGRKATQRMRADIFHLTGRDVLPERIRTAMADFKRDAWESGEIIGARLRLKQDIEFNRHREMLWRHITGTSTRLMQAIKVIDEKDEALTFAWAEEIAGEIREDRHIIVHAPTVVRVLDQIEEAEQDIDSMCRRMGLPTKEERERAVQEIKIRAIIKTLESGGTAILRPDEDAGIARALQERYPGRVLVLSPEEEAARRLEAMEAAKTGSTH